MSLTLGLQAQEKAERSQYKHKRSALMAEELGLNEAQQDQLTKIQAEKREKIKAARLKAKEENKAIWTESEQQIKEVLGDEGYEKYKENRKAQWAETKSKREDSRQYRKGKSHHKHKGMYHKKHPYKKGDKKNKRE